MSALASLGSPQRHAPRFLRALFYGVFVAFIASCDRQGHTPDWPSTPDPKAAFAASNQETPAKQEAQPKAQAPTAHQTRQSNGSGFRFISYNVKNWLTQPEQGKTQPEERSKPDSEKEAVIQLLVRHSPDVVGLCEIGTPNDLAEIQQKLKTANLDLPHSYYTGGADPVRHLALLSRFPIVSTSKAAETEYRMAGHTGSMNRGILDATLESQGKFYRLLGVHLKSKRDSAQGDQETIRLNEARLLRRHIDAIFKTDASARLIVYGDFNDTPSTPAIKTVSGHFNTPGFLTALPAKDSRQDAWTHYWEFQDTYTRFDYIMVTRSLKPEVDFSAVKIIDDPEWSHASDHRPVIAVFR